MKALDCYTLDGAAGRQVELPAEWFDVDVNRNAMYQAVRAQQTNGRAGTASTKSRSEVRGSTAKPWRQKGTGRARAGSARSPLWEGGGVIHGPSPKRWRERIPKRVRRAAFASALSERARNDRVRVVSIDPFDRPKTSRLALAVGRWDIDGKLLILTAGTNENLFLSGRNLPGVTVKKFSDASAFDVLNHEFVAIEEGAWESRPTSVAESAGDVVDG